MPYRRQLIGLPLQRSVFGRIHLAGDILGLSHVLADGRFGASLDGRGNLFLDTSSIGLLADALPSRITPEYLRTMEGHLRATCDDALSAAAEAARASALLDEPGTRQHLAELLTKISAVIPYGILSKFVPDVLMGVLASRRGDVDPPAPDPSAGVELTKALLTLYRDCRDRGYSLERLEAEWPEVEPAIAALVRRFCARYTGYGPLAWEAPGYEQPRYVFRILSATLLHADPDDVLCRLSPSHRPAPAAPADNASIDAALTRVVALWLDFLERETWYVRRAFYAGIVPLLRRLTVLYRHRARDMRAEDLLFLEIDELTLDSPDIAAIRARRQAYDEDDSYLSRHGIEGDALSTMFEDP